ncbi:putative duf1752-domain-containing protein [Erysiphe necator]|uniref:Putative duf1752-domain-containing protein n=1 Tax=Uncinula necator TaxID=52586 RepID=A0A0B1NYW9_UNCNE|nr:putative duf1752-domain-containing protein [Erysiphe necator]
MSSRLLDKPVLRVDAAAIQQVDLRNLESLRRMWTVFTHCASALEEGRRLENLSWRVWTRETLCCDPNTQNAILKPPSTYTTSLRSVLKLQSDTQGNPSHHVVNYVPRHTNSDDLNRILTTITEKKETRPSMGLKPTEEDKISQQDSFPKKDSSVKLIVPEEKPKTNSTNVVRGFSPVRLLRTGSSRRFDVNPSSIPTADITAAAPTKNTQPKTKMIFALGGSSEDSFEPCLSTRVSSREEIEKPHPQKNTIFSFGASSNEDETLPGNTDGTAACKDLLNKNSIRRPTTFQEEVARRTILEEAIVDDVFESDEEDMVNESAIDEDDSSEWEDSVGGSGNASVEEKSFFQRVDSRANLTSRRSLITTMLHQQDRMNALMNEAMKSKSASTINPKLTMTKSLESPEIESRNAHYEVVEKIEFVPETTYPNAKPIERLGHSSKQLALSPRTTRRNMLASELTVSLRQHLLWERKQKSQTTNAALKRRHTSQDVAHLKQYSEPSHLIKDEINSSWDNYFDGGLSEYNARGW